MPNQKQLPIRIKTLDRDNFRTYYLWRDDASRQAWLFFSYNTQGSHDNYSRGDIFPCAGIALPPRLARIMGISKLGAELGEAYGVKETSLINSLKEPTKHEDDVAERVAAGGDTKFKPKQWRNSEKTYYKDESVFMKSLMLEAYEEAQEDIESESHLPEDQRKFVIKQIPLQDFYKEVDRLYYTEGYSFPIVTEGLKSAKRKQARAAKKAEAESK
jgi:hypothetical protein